MKLQISLEFLIMLSFVLLVFIFLLYIISNQRTTGLASQSFSQLQLIAQSVALQLYKAQTGGNGYSTQISVYGTVLTSNTFNITITKAGTVILQEHVGGQKVQAISYSSVRNIVSNPLFLAPGSTTSYIIPVSNGTISVQNSFGTLCLDYQCPSSSGTPSQISLSSQNVYASTFSGQSSTNYVSIPSLTALNGQGSYSISAWIKYNGGTQYLSQNPNPIGWSGCHMGLMFTNVPHVELGFIEWYSTVSNPSPGCPGGTQGNLYEYAAVQPNTWYFVTGTVNQQTGAVSFYLNGVLAMTANVPGGSYLANFAETGYFGDKLDENANGEFFNGSIANVQVYNTALSTNQITSLYNSGIASSPLSSNVVGWWPLNGNANDYSGLDNNGNSHGFILFPSVSEIFGKVVNTNGQALNNLLVGFSTTLGNLTNLGKGISSFNYTNSNGIATAFLNSNYTNGFANVRATVFDGNTSYQGNLIGWWPLNSGQGNVIPDISTYLNSGTSNNGVYWNSPNYVASLNGQTSYFEQQNIYSFMSSATQPFTISIWVDPSSPNGVIVSELGQQTPNTAWHDAWVDLVNGQVYIRVWDLSCINIGSIPDNTWSNIIMTGSVSGSTLTYSGYINGVLGNSNSGSRTAPSSGGYYSVGTADSTNCGSGSNFAGSVADYQFYNTALSSAQVYSLYSEGPQSTPTSPSNLVSWWPLNGNANDYSGNGNNGTIYGNYQFANSNFPSLPFINQSSISAAKFDGSSSYISAGTNALPSGNAPRSVSAWIYPTGSCTNACVIYFYGTDSSSPYGYGLYVTSSYHLEVEFDSGNGAATSTAVLSQNTWYHVVTTYSGSASSIYIDGVYDGGVSYSSASTQVGSSYIGEWSTGCCRFQGSIANVQVYNTTLSAQQVRTLYAKGVEGPPININNLVAWYALNGNTTDSGLRNNTGTATSLTYTGQNDFIPSGTSALGPYGINLNGANGYVSANNIQRVPQFTLSAWLYADGYPTGYTRVISLDNYGSSPKTGWTLLGDSPGTSLYTALFTSSGSEFDSGKVPVTTNSWQNIVISYNGLTPTIYNDGVPSSYGFPSTGVLNPSANVPLVIGGGDSNLVNGFFHGSIADVQLYNAPLSSQQVSQLYNLNMPITSSINVPVGWLP